ncbi:gas vesicle protein K [Nocardiopsis sp. ATB16-24]|uniref:gas vesicle protein K n=1 Tax=Nocardiopsis sp. ATB16-24 TaxID=3019555 RepID=UPI002555001F|nr:gas vesicle protein K [Nocardiopsis sp. ATB16-24]
MAEGSDGPPRRVEDSPEPVEAAVVRDIDEVTDTGGERDILGELQNALDATARRGATTPPAETERGRLRHRIETEPDTVERDLIKLVLTVVELVRQLMERQALRRVDVGDLTEEQEERIGMTLMLLEERMTELRERYGLSVADLNIDLGPLGSLLPRDHGEGE